MADWDDTSPADNDIVSQYPSNERDARAAVVANFGVDHHETNDADVGKHEVIQVLDNAADPTIDAGEVGVWNNGGVLNTRVGAGSVARVVQFAAGTKQVFYQASAPTGWTQDVAVNDQVLKVVSGSGGGTGGSWTISGVTVDSHTLTTAEMPSHTHSTGTLSIGNNGTHDHGGSTGSDGGHTHDIRENDNDSTNPLANAVDSALFSGSALNGGVIEPVSNHNHTIGGDGNHSHSITGTTANTGSGSGHNHGVTADGAWRPSHIDVIVAALD